MRRLFAAAALLVCAGLAAAHPYSASQPRTPSLVVLLVIDQMRTDYLDRGIPHFTAGLRRLTSEGAWYREAAYPHLNTVTCAGHATIATGALPYRHGMVLNAWWDRQRGRTNPCTTDDSVKNIGYEGNPTGGDSARALLVPTLAERLRERTGGRTVSISLKPRSAIPLAGRRATAVVWFNEQAGWTTSTAYTRVKLPWLETFFAADQVSADVGKQWDKLLPESAYQGVDEGEGERFPQGWTRTFPHVLEADRVRFHSQWQRSPFADEYVGRLAAATVDALSLGRRNSVDLLAVSFSTLDITGHQFGPASHEVQDLVLRLDRTIGALLDHLDRAVGKGRYVVGFSSDHGVGEITEQLLDSGRLAPAQVLDAVNRALVPFFGPGRHAIHSAYTDVYFAADALKRIKAKAAAKAAVLSALRALPGVDHAFFAEEVAAARNAPGADPVRRAASLSYYAPRSGDVIIVPKQGWMLSTTAAATHGTLHPHDQRVPVIFYGTGVDAGRHATRATPADIAPTLGALAGIRFAAPDGKALLPLPADR